MWLMKTLLTSGCTNQRGAGHDGSPLTFGYDVLDLQENNIGVVGQGSRLFIRVDEIPTGIKVALNDEQNLFCTITFQHVIDENKTYICQ